MSRRLVQLYVALVLYGVSMALMIRSELGNMPWDVLHQGLAEQLGLPFGVVIVLVSALVLLTGGRCTSGRGWARSPTSS